MRSSSAGRPTRRQVLTGSLLTLGTGSGLLSLTGCGGGAQDDASSPAEDVRRIPGGLGEVELRGTPARVVSVGQYRDTDAAVALGVVPLLSPDLSGFLDGGVAPWVVAELAGRELALMDATELPFERIAALEPDLVLATDRSALEEEYDQLTQIAPTLSWDQGYNQDDWKTTTTRVGEALNRASQAAEQIAATEAAIAAARAANPDFEGLTFTFGPVTGEGQVNTINSAEDASAEFFAQLGLQLSPTVTALPDASFPGRAAVSQENLLVLDADLLVLTFNTPAARTTLEADPLFQSIPAVQRGAYVPLELPVALAMGFPSALSIRWGLEQVVPAIRAVLG